MFWSQRVLRLLRDYDLLLLDCYLFVFCLCVFAICVFLLLFFRSKQLLDGLLKVVCCTSCIASCVLDRDDEVAHCNACASMFGSCEPQGSVGTLVQ